MAAIEEGAFAICEISTGRPEIAQIVDGAGRHFCDVWKAPRDRDIAAGPFVGLRFLEAAHRSHSSQTG